MSKVDLNEVCLKIIDMCESSINMSKTTMLSDSIHKEGLVGTLNDIIEVIKENTND